MWKYYNGKKLIDHMITCHIIITAWLATYRIIWHHIQCFFIQLTTKANVWN